MTSGNPLSTAGVTKLAATMIVGVIVIAAILAPMLNDLTRETIVEDYNNPDDASWIRMNYGTGNIDTEYSVAGDTLTIGDQSGAAQEMILYADEKACVMYSDGFTIVNGYSDPATVTKAETVHITNADGTLTISDGTDIIIQTTSPAWSYYPDKEGTYGYFSADVDGVKVKDGNQAMIGNFAGVYTYNNLIIGPDNLGDLGMSIDMDIQDGVIQTITWAKGVADADADPNALTNAQISGGSSMPNLGTANPSTGTRIGDLYYTFSGTDATVIGYASTIDWTTFTSIPDTVVDNGTTYTVTSIGSNAFFGCTNLALTSLPSGLTGIGQSAFSGCTNLALTSLPSGITSINNSVFQNCTSLALISLPSGLTNISGSAFNGCTTLALTSLPNNITSIGDNAFRDCTSLALTSLPDRLTTIGNYTFSGCTNLALTSLPSGITTIGGNAFADCTNLALTSLPSGLTAINSLTFYRCTNLALTSLPSGVTSISNSAFNGCTNLALTSLPDGVTTIGFEAFRGCSNIKISSLPSGLTSLSEGAFRECTSIVNITVPNISVIDLNTFRECINLETITFSDNLSMIGGYAFQGCTNLALTSLPDSVTLIGREAFSGCTNLALTSLPDSLTTVSRSAFAYCTNLALTSLPSGLTKLEQGAFYDCVGIDSLIIQSSPTIGSNAFGNCTNLKQILNLGDTEITTTSYGLNADEVRSDIPAMGYVAPLSYTKVVVKEGTAYDILLMMPVLLVIALLIPIADYFVGDKIRSRIR